MDKMKTLNLLSISSYSLSEPLNILYQLLSTLLGLPLAYFYLIYKTKPLNPKYSASDYNIYDLESIQIMIRCLGGRPPSKGFGRRLLSRARTMTTTWTKRSYFDIVKHVMLAESALQTSTLSSLQNDITNQSLSGREKSIEEIYSKKFKEKILTIVTCNDQDTIIVAVEGNWIHYCDCELNFVLEPFRVELQTDESINCLSMSCDDQYLYIGTNLGNIYAYDAPNCKFWKCVITQINSNYTKLGCINQIASMKLSTLSGEDKEYVVILDKEGQLIFYNYDLEEAKNISEKLTLKKKIKQFRVNDEKFSLYCVTANNLIYKIDLIKNDNNEVEPLYVALYPQDDEFQSLINYSIQAAPISKEDLSEYYSVVLLMISSPNTKLFWASKSEKIICGMDKQKLMRIIPGKEIKSQYVGLLRGAYIYASRYENEIKILKNNLLLDEIFNPKNQIINTKFTHSMKKGTFNLSKIEHPASCLAVSPDYKFIYSGWEDGKIRVMNLLKKKEQGELSAPAIQEEILLPEEKERLETDPKTEVKRHERFTVVSSFNHLLSQNENDESRSSEIHEFNSELLVTAIAVNSNLLIAGYSTGIIIFYDPNDNYKFLKGYPIPDGDPEHPELEKIISLVITKDQTKVIVTTTASIFSLALEWKEEQKHMARYDLYQYNSDDLKRSVHKTDITRKSSGGRRGKNHHHHHGIHSHYPHTVVVENLLASRIGPKDFIIVDITNPTNKKHIKLDEKVQGHIIGLGISQDLDKVIVACSRGEINIFEIESQKQLQRFTLKIQDDEDIHLAEMQMTEEGMLIFGFVNGELRAVEIGTQEEIVISKKLSTENKIEKPTMLRNIFLTHDEQYLAVNYSDWTHKMVMLNLTKRKQKATHEIEEQDWIFSISSFPQVSDHLIICGTLTVHSSSITSPPITIHEAEDKSSFLVGLETFNDTHLLITYNTGKVLKLNKKGSQIEFTEFFRIFPEGHVKGIDEELSQVLCSKVSKDCSYIISSIDDPKILIHDMLNPKAEPRKISLKKQASTLDTHPTYHEIFVAGIDRDIHIFSLDSLEALDVIKNCFTTEIQTLVISKKGNMVAAVSKGYEYKIFDWKTQQIVYSFIENRSFQIGKNCLAFAQDDRLLVYCGDEILKILSLDTKTLVYDFKVRKFFTSINVSEDDKYLLCGTSNSEIKIYNMPLTKEETHLIPYSEYISPYARMGSLANILLQFESKQLWHEQLNKNKNLYYWPHNFSILHIIAIMEPHYLENIPPYSKLKIRWIVDKYEKTPLHYLIEAIKKKSAENKNLSYSHINNILSYILDFLEENRTNHHIYFQTMKSLSNILTFILAEASPDLVVKFLKLSFYTQPYIKNTGDTTNEIRLIKIPKISENDIKAIYQEGNEWVKFRILGFYLDLGSLSDETFEILRTLKKLSNQDYFNTKAISTIIDYLWTKNFLYNVVMAILFSILTALISIDFVMDDPPIGIKIAVLVMDGLFIAYKLLQLYSERLKFFKNAWNWLDMFYYIMIIIAIIRQFFSVDDRITMGWIFTSALIVGYGRWISYLRLYNLSRNLIRTIMDMLKNMWAFSIIIIFIILGFSLMFFIFNKEQRYYEALLGTYYMLYGNNNFSFDDISQNILAVTVTFMLGVFFLNMLVAILNNSFETSQKLRVLKDAHERLEIMMESIRIQRLVFRRKYTKGHLILCEKVHDYDKDDEKESDDMEGRIKTLMRGIKDLEKTMSLKFEQFEQKMNEKFKEKDKTMEDGFLYLHHELNANLVELKDLASRAAQNRPSFGVNPTIRSDVY